MKTYHAMKSTDMIKLFLKLTLIFDLSPLKLEIWNKTPSKSAITTSVDSGLWLQRKYILIVLNTKLQIDNRKN